MLPLATSGAPPALLLAMFFREDCLEGSCMVNTGFLVTVLDLSEVTVAATDAEGVVVSDTRGFRFTSCFLCGVVTSLIFSSSSSASSCIFLSFASFAYSLKRSESDFRFCFIADLVLGLFFVSDLEESVLTVIDTEIKENKESSIKKIHEDLSRDDNNQLRKEFYQVQYNGHNTVVTSGDCTSS